MRNLIAYADFLTMAAIALVTCIGFVLPEFFRRIAGTRTAISACVLIWLLSFAIISPMVFGFDLLGHSFGRFGWDSVWGRCNVTKTRDFNYNTAMIIPLIVIFSRYVDAGWQKLHGSTGGTRRKVWTRTKILSPNIRYFVAN